MLRVGQNHEAALLCCGGREERVGEKEEGRRGHRQGTGTRKREGAPQCRGDARAEGAAEGEDVRGRGRTEWKEKCGSEEEERGRGGEGREERKSRGRGRKAGAIVVGKMASGWGQGLGEPRGGGKAPTLWYGSPRPSRRLQSTQTVTCPSGRSS